MEVSLFYLKHPANSYPCENSGFCRILSATGETVETTTDQRNSSIIGRDKIYVSSKKREEMQFILFDESR